MGPKKYAGIEDAYIINATVLDDILRDAETLNLASQDRTDAVAKQLKARVGTAILKQSFLPYLIDGSVNGNQHEVGKFFESFALAESCSEDAKQKINAILGPGQLDVLLGELTREANVYTFFELMLNSDNAQTTLASLRKSLAVQQRDLADFIGEDIKVDGDGVYFELVEPNKTISINNVSWKVADVAKLFLMNYGRRFMNYKPSSDLNNDLQLLHNLEDALHELVVNRGYNQKIAVDMAQKVVGKGDSLEKLFANIPLNLQHCMSQLELGVRKYCNGEKIEPRKKYLMITNPTMLLGTIRYQKKLVWDTIQSGGKSSERVVAKTDPATTERIRNYEAGRSSEMSNDAGNNVQYSTGSSKLMDPYYNKFKLEHETAAQAMPDEFNRLHDFAMNLYTAIVQVCRDSENRYGIKMNYSALFDHFLTNYEEVFFGNLAAVPKQNGTKALMISALGLLAKRKGPDYVRGAYDLFRRVTNFSSPADSGQDGISGIVEADALNEYLAQHPELATNMG